MEKVVPRILGLGLVIAGFILLAMIFNPKGLVIPSTDRAVLFLIFFTVGVMVVFGSYLASGFDPKKGLGILIIGGLSVILILPILYLPLSKDALSVVLGISTFIPLLLWIAYTKLRVKCKEK